MLQIIVDGVKPYDGRYPLDLSAEFTTQEWGWLKRLAGYMPLNVSAGFEGGDPELFAVFAMIALHRAGKVDAKEIPELFQRLGETPAGTTIRLENTPDPDQEEGDADGPPQSSSNGNERTSGQGLARSSETSVSHQPGFGIPDSDTSAWDLSTLPN